jgi:hypothetical protein
VADQDLPKTRAKFRWPNFNGENPKDTAYSIVYRTIYIYIYITENKNSEAKFVNLEKFLELYN